MIITFPVKHRWFEKADIILIKQNLLELAAIRIDSGNIVSGIIYLTRPGCGNGKLNWKDVKPICKEYLDDSFIVVEKGISKPPQD